jgi:NAD(P)-dependent dehydrogenase (short-subunit alcohol dehydrogenase family)
VALDLATPVGPPLLIERAVEEHGRVDVLVNNVGAVRITILASERTGNITGVNYIIDGGLIKTT